MADSALIGGLNNGWAVANTTLMNERAGLGSGGGNAAGGGMAQPGTVMGVLPRRVGDLVAAVPAASGKNGKDKKTEQPAGALGAMRGGAGLLISLAKSRGVNTDAGIRQDLARLHTLGELGRFNGLRVKAAKEQGRDIPGMPNVAKLSMSQIVRLTRDLGLRIAGAVRHAARLRRRREGLAHARRPATPSPAASPRWRCSPRRRPSTAGPTRCSATSSASGCSACPRSPTTTG